MKFKGMKPHGYWNNKDHCAKEALRYYTRNEFKKGSHGAYERSRVNGWLNDICNHMEIVGHLYKRLIYAYEFQDGYVYVGLTCTEDRRNKRHHHDPRSPVYKHVTRSHTIPKYLTHTEYIDVTDAKLEEDKVIKNYRKNGWKLLNTQVAGGIGSVKLFWTADKCKEKAEKYQTRRSFQVAHKGAYNSAWQHGWLDDICSHMK